MRCAIRLGGRGDAETDDERAETTLSTAVEVTFSGRRPAYGSSRAGRALNKSCGDPSIRRGLSDQPFSMSVRR